MEVRIIENLEYPAAIRMLTELHNAVVQNQTNEIVVLTSHGPVITLGRRTDPREVLTERWSRLFAGVGMFFAPRGGGATAHGPGQEVVYPVLSLERRGLGAGQYIEILAEAGRRALLEQGVDAAWDPENPGLYVGGKKIASIGLRVSKGVVSHGLSVNIARDQWVFNLIVPCKHSELRVTSIQEVTCSLPRPWLVGKAIVQELKTLL